MFLMVEQKIWVQSSLTPKIDWCLGQMIKEPIIRSERHKLKLSKIYIKKIYKKIKTLNPKGSSNPGIGQVRLV